MSSQKEKPISSTVKPTVELNAVMSIFTGIPTSELITKIVDPADHDLFKLPLLRRGSLGEELKHIEQLAGNIEKVAVTNSDQLTANLLELTTFPSKPVKSVDLNSYLADLKQLIEMMGGSAILDEEPEEDDIIPDLPLYPDLPDLPDLDELDDIEEDD